MTLGDISLRIYGAVVIALQFWLAFTLGKCSRNNEVRDLATRLSQSEETRKIAEGLYTKRATEIEDLQKALTGKGDEIKSLKKQLDDSGAHLLTVQELAIAWKKAYEGALNVHQTDVPPTVPGEPVRKRVDFSQNLGPWLVLGYTLTDPAEGHVKISQTRALHLSVAMARNPNGTWSSYVTADDPDVNVDVGVSAVDTKVLSPPWYGRLWMDVGVDAIGDRRASATLSYRFDSWSVGAGCSLGLDSRSCGLSIGRRIFR